MFTINIMSQQLTPEQIEKLKALGIDVGSENQVATPSVEPVVETPKLEIPPQPEKISSPKKPIPKVFPLLSISGLTVLSFGGIILFKSKNSAINTVTPPVSHSQNQVHSNQDQPTPTQVPKSIQHYLLASQQYFSQALELQNSKTADLTASQQTVNLINQSIVTASSAIKEFPQDYRGYYQRAKIYQSLVNAKPEFITQTIADLSFAQRLNPSSPDITHDLASAYAHKGDAQNTIAYLAQTVSLDPTKAQNFYDLAKIQQQAGFIPQALDTYNHLLSLITDPTQKTQVEQEKSALEKLVAQTPKTTTMPTPSPIKSDIQLPDNPPTLQAMANDTGLIIAAPETGTKISVENVTDSNALSGTAILPAKEKSLTIKNTNLSDKSQVYVTIVTGGKNQTLQVLSKDKDSFTVGLDTAINEAINFKWWIIN